MLLGPTALADLHLATPGWIPVPGRVAEPVSTPRACPVHPAPRTGLIRQSLPSQPPGWTGTDALHRTGAADYKPGPCQGPPKTAPQAQPAPEPGPSLPPQPRPSGRLPM